MALRIGIFFTSDDVRCSDVEENEAENVREPVSEYECGDEPLSGDEPDNRREQVGNRDIHQQVVPPG